MKNRIVLLFACFLTLLLFAGCEEKGSRTVTKEPGDARIQDIVGNQNKSEAKILQSWQGDYPVSQLNLLPGKQLEQAVGYIGDTEIFEDVWNVFKPGEDVPVIDFKASLVLFARNTQFYNRISIGKVNVTNGVAEVLAMETMSAMPIEDKVAMSLAVVSRKGITAIHTGDKKIPIITEGQRHRGTK